MAAGLAAVVAASGMVMAQGRDSRDQVRFPEGFNWCVATAAHQIEGYNEHSDWWLWEEIPGNVKNGEHSGAACDHWNRLEEDTALLRDLGVRQYRFSVEWAKIEPREGEFDEAALEHYEREVALLIESGIDPLVTLHHFTMPQWLRAKGGWEWEGAPAAFERYAALVYRRLGPHVRDWVSINEPMVHVVGGYLAGLTPPGKTDVNELAVAVLGMLRSHARAYRVMHEMAAEAGREIRVGFAHHLRVFTAAHALNPLDQFGAKMLDRAFNWSFIDAIETGRFRVHIPFVINVDERIENLAGTQDFLGINYYTRDLVRMNFEPPLYMSIEVNRDARLTDLEWEIYPEGFEKVLRRAHRRYPRYPIIITENGLADSRDAMRIDFLKSHLAVLSGLIDEGVPIEGYCHWSFMDNFEWIEGFEPRFGLYEVDYSTFERRPRPSALWYTRTIRDNGFVW